MEEVRIKLSAVWIALMLTYLLGDVLRIFSGDFKAGEIGGMQASQILYLGLAVLLVIPVVMVLLSLTLPYKANRWANIIVGVFYTGWNLIGFSSYPSACDKFLIVVSIVLTAQVVWYA